jgi:hypothetical protein
MTSVIEAPESLTDENNGKIVHVSGRASLNGQGAPLQDDMFPFVRQRDAS